MIGRLHIRPAMGLLIREPETMRALPPEGRVVAGSSYWLRRLRDGDVVEVAPDEAPDEAPDGAEVE